MTHRLDDIEKVDVRGQDRISISSADLLPYFKDLPKPCDASNINQLAGCLPQLNIVLNKPSESHQVSNTTPSTQLKDLLEPKKVDSSPIPRDIRDRLPNALPPSENCREMVEDVVKAIAKGDVSAIQDLLKGIKTPEDFDRLKEAVKYLNQFSKDFQIDCGKRLSGGEPYLHITAEQDSVLLGCGGGFRADSIFITKDSASASSTSDIGYVPQKNFPIGAKDALKSAYSVMAKFEEVLPKGNSAKPRERAERPQGTDKNLLNLINRFG